MEDHWKFLGGGLKAKLLEEKCETKPECPGVGGGRGRVWGYKTKNHLWGEYGYFLELFHTF